MLLKTRISLKTDYPPQPGPEDSPSLLKKLFQDRGSKTERQPAVQETFPALPFMQQLAAVFRAMKIENIISITHDGNDFYTDGDEKSGDLPQILDKFNDEINRMFGQYLAVIRLSAETEQEGVRYSILTTIEKIHKPGRSPVIMEISGLVDRKKGGKEEAYFFFIDQLELSMKKHIPGSEIYRNREDDDPSKEKNGVGIDDDNAAAPHGGKQRKSPAGKADGLFPLFGVTPGKTTEKELALLGQHSSMRDDKGELYKYYVVKGMNFWYDGGRATHMYITYTDPLPDQWRSMGFSWEHSYDRWIGILQGLNWEVQIIKEPKTIPHFKGKGKSFEAEIMATARAAGRDYLLRFDFNYSNKSGRNDKGTLYSISINTP